MKTKKRKAGRPPLYKTKVAFVQLRLRAPQRKLLAKEAKLRKTSVNKLVMETLLTVFPQMELTRL